MSILSLLLIVDNAGGGVGGVDISIIFSGVDITGIVSFADRGGDGDGDGGSGSTNVRNAWLTRSDEHEYG